MDQDYYYMTNYFTPDNLNIYNNFKKESFENKYKLNYNGLKQTGSFNDGGSIIYTHYPTNRLFIYKLIHKSNPENKVYEWREE